eukprot:2467842-Alexandrium_andersonii.AAC.1
MSASLVGSEMCIRDSSNTSASRGLDAYSERGGLPAESQCCPWSVRSICCLLYTSDAADDM